MLAVEGIYENGEIKLLQEISNVKKARVYVILIPEDDDDRGTKDRRIIQQIEPIKIKGETLSETVIKERNESCYLMKMQQQTGYIQALLNDSAEDVWNNL